MGGCADKVPLGDVASLSVAPVYRLGPGDAIRIGVFNETGMSGDFMVADDGMISFPLLGSVKADGLTPEELRVAIAAGLGAGYVNNPRVTAQVISYRPYYVMGEVAQPGRYPLSDRVTVVRAIAVAGGYTYRANKKTVYLRRQGQTEVKLPASADFQVLPGDVIRIGERYF
ncbi:MAG: polysaccharide export protein [bacterium]|nr:polysaccharide export protein [bacterium]